ncbi:CdaR family protein [Flavobacterium sp. CS20]|jgi:hypothetical protein|uniref:CdaR family protein n=1 Tax=Flavobacterium sp. CS20 TaxID=2775246 RepID=UPI001B39CFDF|nr:YbbR-like domain-containing protein [Flavobacterium sp. CS20]QTY27993.1 YbbR-like domain-containing protein [Flavobacterium sp. CS20]
MKTTNLIKLFSAKNYKAYAVFLSLTFILWFVIQLVKTYNYNTDLMVEIDQIPKQFVVDTTTKTIKVNIKASGLKLWQYNLSSKTITINYADFNKETSLLKISKNSIIDKMTNNFPFDSENISIEDNELAFGFRKKATKKVPVRIIADLNFKSGYNTLQSIQPIPDSVVITGPKNELKNINYIQTQKLILKNIKDTLSSKISLEIPSENIEATTSQVEYYLPVEKFSEKTLMVDIETINIPDTLQLTTYPSQAKVSFLVSLKSFDKISNSDFQVICDYKKRYEDDAIMIPKLEKYPKNIIGPKLHINKVDYLIKRKS